MDVAVGGQGSCYAYAKRYQAAGLFGRQWERNAVSRDRYLQSQTEWATWTKIRTP